MTNSIVANVRDRLFGPDCSNIDDPGSYNFDECGTDAVDNEVLFLKETADVDAVDTKDVTQDKLADCALMATLVALARTPEGRALVKNAITQNKNDRGEISYTVTLHQRDSLHAEKFTDVKVTVRGPYAHGHAKPAGEGSRQEVWPLVIEKAYAVFKGGYNQIGRGGNPCEAMEALTGRPAQRIDLRWPSQIASCGEVFGGAPLKPYSAEDLQRDLAAGKMIVLETPRGLQQTEREHRLIENHAYAVMGTEEHGGQLYVKLKNPWNVLEKEPTLVPIDELTTCFNAVDIGSAK
jgi:hypothetical protein